MNTSKSRKTGLGSGALVGFLAAAPLVAVLNAGYQLLGTPQPYFELFDRVSRILPGALITFGIDTMVAIFSRLPGVSTNSASKAAEQTMAIVLFMMLGALFGALIAFALRRTPTTIPVVSVGAIVALIPALLTLVMENFNIGSPVGPIIACTWIIMTYLLWGIAVATVLERIALLRAQATPEAPTNRERRVFLLQFGGGALGLAVLISGAGRLLSGVSGTAGSGVASLPTPSPTPMPVGGPTPSFVAVPGTRLEVTPNELFYRVDINTVVPEIEPAKWQLSVGGAVDNSFIIGYDELLKMPFVEQHATLECISNPVGGGLISSTLWKGVPLKDMLDKAKLKDGVVEIRFTSLDGYNETLPLKSALDPRTLLAYATNGEPLLPEHGYPLRLYTPDRYGMKNPKWITTIEAITQEENGYWTDRGWDKQAFVKSTSIIDAVVPDKANGSTVPMGGIAFAGARGISKVELSVDGGPWQAAQIKEPLSPLTWRLWRYDWAAVAGKGVRTATVRCYDDAGTVQIQQEAPLHPDGASGYVTKNFLVS